MPARLQCEVADSQTSVFAQASGDRADPARRLPLRLPARPFQESLQRFTNAILGGFHLASASKVAHLSADATTDPQHDRHTRQQTASKPGRIELDLDLLEPDRRGRVAMTRAGAIEDRGWP